MPDLEYELNAWKSGLDVIGGVDEVGRGAFAGPVVAACVAFPQSFGQYTGMVSSAGVKIDDSKKLTQLQRTVAYDWIISNCMSWGIGTAKAGEIDKLGINIATQIAYRMAVSETVRKAGRDLDLVLVDAYKIDDISTRQVAIIKGDSKSVSIAAASIVAKVYRDTLMAKYAQEAQYGPYCWHKNKGYGTSTHCRAIEKYGICRLHRKSYINSYFKKRSNQ